MGIVKRYAHMPVYAHVWAVDEVIAWFLLHNMDSWMAALQCLHHVHFIIQELLRIDMENDLVCCQMFYCILFYCCFTANARKQVNTVITF